CTILPPQSIVYCDSRAVVRTWDRRNHCHLLARRSANPARAPSTRTGTSCTGRLERTDGERERVRNLQPAVLSALSRSAAAGAILRRRLLPCGDHHHSFDRR